MLEPIFYFHVISIVNEGEFVGSHVYITKRSVWENEGRLARLDDYTKEELELFDLVCDEHALWLVNICLHRTGKDPQVINDLLENEPGFAWDEDFADSVI